MKRQRCQLASLVLNFTVLCLPFILCSTSHAAAAGPVISLPCSSASSTILVASNGSFSFNCTNLAPGGSLYTIVVNTSTVAVATVPGNISIETWQPFDQLIIAGGIISTLEVVISGPVLPTVRIPRGNGSLPEALVRVLSEFRVDQLLLLSVTINSTMVITAEGIANRSRFALVKLDAFASLANSPITFAGLLLLHTTPWSALRWEVHENVSLIDAASTPLSVHVLLEGSASLASTSGGLAAGVWLHPNVTEALVTVDHRRLDRRTAGNSYFDIVAFAMVRVSTRLLFGTPVTVRNVSFLVHSVDSMRLELGMLLLGDTDSSLIFFAGVSITLTDVAAALCVNASLINSANVFDNNEGLAVAVVNVSMLVIQDSVWVMLRGSWSTHKEIGSIFIYSSGVSIVGHSALMSCNATAENVVVSLRNASVVVTQRSDADWPRIVALTSTAVVVNSLFHLEDCRVTLTSVTRSPTANVPGIVIGSSWTHCTLILSRVAMRVQSDSSIVYPSTVSAQFFGLAGVEASTIVVSDVSVQCCCCSVFFIYGPLTASNWTFSGISMQLGGPSGTLNNRGTFMVVVVKDTATSAIANNTIVLSNAAVALADDCRLLFVFGAVNGSRIVFAKVDVECFRCSMIVGVATFVASEFRWDDAQVPGPRTSRCVVVDGVGVYIENAIRSTIQFGTLVQVPTSMPLATMQINATSTTENVSSSFAFLQNVSFDSNISVLGCDIVCVNSRAIAVGLVADAQLPKSACTTLWLERCRVSIANDFSNLSRWGSTHAVQIGVCFFVVTASPHGIRLLVRNATIEIVQVAASRRNSITSFVSLQCEQPVFYDLAVALETSHVTCRGGIWFALGWGSSLQNTSWTVISSRLDMLNGTGAAPSLFLMLASSLYDTLLVLTDVVVRSGPFGQLLQAAELMGLVAAIVGCNISCDGCGSLIMCSDNASNVSVSISPFLPSISSNESSATLRGASHIQLKDGALLSTRNARGGYLDIVLNGTLSVNVTLGGGLLVVEDTFDANVTLTMQSTSMWLQSTGVHAAFLFCHVSNSLPTVMPYSGAARVWVAADNVTIRLAGADNATTTAGVLVVNVALVSIVLTRTLLATVSAVPTSSVAFLKDLSSMSTIEVFLLHVVDCVIDIMNASGLVFLRGTVQLKARLARTSVFIVSSQIGDPDTSSSLAATSCFGFASISSQTLFIVEDSILHIGGAPQHQVLENPSSFLLVENVDANVEVSILVVDFASVRATVVSGSVFSATFIRSANISMTNCTIDLVSCGMPALFVDARVVMSMSVVVNVTGIQLAATVPSARAAWLHCSVVCQHVRIAIIGNSSLSSRCNTSFFQSSTPLSVVGLAVSVADSYVECSGGSLLNFVSLIMYSTVDITGTSVVLDNASTLIVANSTNGVYLTIDGFASQLGLLPVLLLLRNSMLLSMLHDILLTMVWISNYEDSVVRLPKTMILGVRLDAWVTVKGSYMVQSSLGMIASSQLTIEHVASMIVVASPLLYCEGGLLFRSSTIVVQHCGDITLSGSSSLIVAGILVWVRIEVRNITALRVAGQSAAVFGIYGIVNTNVSAALVTLLEVKGSSAFVQQALGTVNVSSSIFTLASVGWGNLSASCLFKFEKAMLVECQIVLYKATLRVGVDDGEDVGEQASTIVDALHLRGCRIIIEKSLVDFDGSNGDVVGLRCPGSCTNVSILVRAYSLLRIIGVRSALAVLTGGPVVNLALDHTSNVTVANGIVLIVGGALLSAAISLDGVVTLSAAAGLLLCSGSIVDAYVQFQNRSVVRLLDYSFLSSLTVGNRLNVSIEAVGECVVELRLASSLVIVALFGLSLITSPVSYNSISMKNLSAWKPVLLEQTSALLLFDLDGSRSSNSTIKIVVHCEFDLIVKNAGAIAVQRLVNTAIQLEVRYRGVFTEVDDMEIEAGDGKYTYASALLVISNSSCTNVLSVSLVVLRGSSVSLCNSSAVLVVSGAVDGASLAIRFEGTSQTSSALVLQRPQSLTSSKGKGACILRIANAKSTMSSSTVTLSVPMVIVNCSSCGTVGARTPWLIAFDGGYEEHSFGICNSSAVVVEGISVFYMPTTGGMSSFPPASAMPSSFDKSSVLHIAGCENWLVAVESTVTMQSIIASQQRPPLSLPRRRVRREDFVGSIDEPQVDKCSASESLQVSQSRRDTSSRSLPLSDTEVLPATSTISLHSTSPSANAQGHSLPLVVSAAPPMAVVSSWVSLAVSSTTLASTSPSPLQDSVSLLLALSVECGAPGKQRLSLLGDVAWWELLVGLLAFAVVHAAIAVTCAHFLAQRSKPRTATHSKLRFPALSISVGTAMVPLFVSTGIAEASAKNNASVVAAVFCGVVALVCVLLLRWTFSTFVFSCTTLDCRTNRVADHRSQHPILRVLVPHGQWHPVELRNRFGPVFSSLSAAYLEWRVPEMAVGIFGGVLTGAATASPGVGGCESSMALMGITHFLAAVAGGVRQPYRLPSDNILSPTSHGLLSLLCFLKASPILEESQAAIVVFALLHTIVTLLRSLVSVSVYLWQRFDGTTSSGMVDDNNVDDTSNCERQLLPGAVLPMMSNHRKSTTGQSQGGDDGFEALPSLQSSWRNSQLALLTENLLQLQRNRGFTATSTVPDGCATNDTTCKCLFLVIQIICKGQRLRGR